jgi:hypothetical protein
MMVQEKEHLTPEDLRYLKVTIASALGLDDIIEMPKTRYEIANFIRKSRE